MNWFRKIAEKTEVRIGVVGYSSQKFDIEKAKKSIEMAFDDIEKVENNTNFIVISGLTDLGIPALAYQEAVRRDWKTVGVACNKTKEFDTFDCDEVIIEGDEWGDESDKFLSMIDYFVKIGGGEQSKEELKKAKEKNIKVIEYKL